MDRQTDKQSISNDNYDGGINLYGCAWGVHSTLLVNILSKQTSLYLSIKVLFVFFYDKQYFSIKLSFILGPKVFPSTIQPQNYMLF